MMTQTQLLSHLQRLQLPESDQSGLSFCHYVKAAQVAAWAAQLPATRVIYSSALLYKALPELTLVKTQAQTRLDMLEVLRPYVIDATNGLAKNFLHKPLMLPEGAMKSAVVSQALQKHLTTGYLQVVKELLSAPRGKDDTPLLLALHRAMSGLGLQLFRSAQLYTSPPPHLWIQAHTLYLLAETADLHNKPLQTADDHDSTLNQQYLRMLLLACANPNQLTQSDIQRLFEALENWSPLASLSHRREEHDIYVVSLHDNAPPTYIPFAEDAQEEGTRFLNLTRLTQQLEQLAQGSSDTRLKLPAGMNLATIDHCLSRWQQRHERQRPRRPTHGMLEVTVGLTAIHTLLSEAQPAPKSGTTTPAGSAAASSARFNAKQLSTEYDPWADAFDASGINNPGYNEKPLDFKPVSGASQNQSQSNIPTFKIDLVDSSASGYCLQWQQETPPQLKAGELIAVRENGRATWNISLIRWVRQVKGATQLGVQLLGPEAEPMLARIVHKSGENSESLRVLRLPEMRQIGVGATLLTASLPFKRQHKVMLSSPTQHMLVQLTETFQSTSSINQFGFRQLEDTSGTPSEDYPDSSW